MIGLYAKEGFVIAINLFVYKREEELSRAT